MDVSTIFSAAKEAGQKWSRLSVAERLSYLRRFRLLVADKAVELGEILQRTTGKLQFEALTAEILTVVDTLRYWEKHAARQLKPCRKTTPFLLFGRRSWVEYKPRGVVLVIAPWNYPFQLSMIPTLGALLAGNAVILKPSEVTSELDAVFSDLFLQAGFPEDLVQVVSGDGSVGAALTGGKPDLIFFTGSVATGKVIQREAASDLIPTILELGGKDAMIVLDDAPLRRAIQGALWGSFTNCGQVCLGTERIFVQESVHDIFLQELEAGARELQLGKLTSLRQVQVIGEQMEDALSKGARLITGTPPSNWEQNSLHIEASIISGLSPDMIMTHTETFGPVVSVTPFSSLEEAVHLANGTSYGLGASVWSKDLGKAKRLASKLHVGNVSINDTMITIANPHLPFGGFKTSGLGAYHGEGGLRVFCLQVAVMASRGKKGTELNWFPYTEEKEQLVVELIKTLYGSRKDYLELAKRGLTTWIRKKQTRQ